MIWQQKNIQSFFQFQLFESSSEFSEATFISCNPSAFIGSRLSLFSTIVVFSVLLSTLRVSSWV